MLFPFIEELSLTGVFDRGIANHERIILNANEKVNLGQFGLMLGIKLENGMSLPVRDNLFWFGDGFINKGDWVFIYTGPGEPKISEIPNNKERIISVHWGREKTILGDVNVVPILFKVGEIIVESNEAALKTVDRMLLQSPQ